MHNMHTTLEYYAYYRRSSSYVYCSTRRTSPNLASSSIIVTSFVWFMHNIDYELVHNNNNIIYIYIYYGSMEKIKFDDNMHTFVVHTINTTLASII